MTKPGPQLEGPYTAEDVIMRGSNPAITRFRGELRLWHSLGGGPAGPATQGYCASCTNGSTPYSCRNESTPRQAPLAAGARLGAAANASTAAAAAAAPPVSAKLVVASSPAGPWRDIRISCLGWAGDPRAVWDWDSVSV